MPPHVSATSHSLTAARHTVAAATGEQVPTEAESEQLSQVPPLQAELQQTLSTQKPLKQALVALHGVPFASLSVQTPPEQYSPLAQSPSSVQPLAQTGPAQVEPGQFTV